MRIYPPLLSLALLGLMVLPGCNRGALGGNSSASGDSSDQEQKQQTQQKKQSGQAEPADTGPQNTVRGEPSAASDRGSADAIAHRSVAQPGAPEGTVPDSAGNPPPKPPSPKPRSPQH